MKPFTVGRNDRTGQVFDFDTLPEAEAKISEIQKHDPSGVAAGEYYIDGPDEEVQKSASKPFDLTGQIMLYEEGQLDEESVIDLFQFLVNTGLAWSLQGSYGRTAIALIQEGKVIRPQR